MCDYLAVFVRLHWWLVIHWRKYRRYYLQQSSLGGWSLSQLHPTIVGQNNRSHLHTRTIWASLPHALWEEVSIPKEDPHREHADSVQKPPSPRDSNWEPFCCVTTAPPCHQELVFEISIRAETFWSTCFDVFVWKHVLSATSAHKSHLKHSWWEHWWGFEGALTPPRLQHTFHLFWLTWGLNQDLLPPLR